MDNTQSQTEIKTKELQQFNYVSDKLHQSMLKNAYQAINLTEMWDYIKKNTNYFMINDDNEIQIISQICDNFIVKLESKILYKKEPK